MHHKLKQDIEELKKDINDGFACLVIMDGMMGHGKTTLAIEYADEYEGKEIDLTKQYAVGGEDFINKLNICIKEGLGVIVYDEAGDFNKKRTMSSFSQALNEVFETFRAFKILIVLALPRFSVLDNGLFDKGVPRMLYHCYRERDVKYSNIMAYNLWRMEYLRFKLPKTVVKQEIYNKVTPNYRAKFVDLPPERRKLIAEISLAQKKKRTKKTEEKINLNEVMV